MGSRMSDTSARFWVHDDGPGIPPAERDRLFDRFARGDASAQRGGTGLGLAIVAAISRAHGGRVELDSEPEAGTTFTIVVPTGPTRGGRQ